MSQHIGSEPEIGPESPQHSDLISRLGVSEPTSIPAYNHILLGPFHQVPIMPIMSRSLFNTKQLSDYGLKASCICIQTLLRSVPLRAPFPQQSLNFSLPHPPVRSPTNSTTHLFGHSRKAIPSSLCFAFVGIPPMVSLKAGLQSFSYSAPTV